MFGKSLELLKKVAPAVTRVGFIFNPDMSAYYDQFLPAFEAEARQYSIELTVARVGTEAEIDAAIAKLAAAPGGGLMVPPDAYTLVHRDLIVQSTARYRIPAIYSYRQLIKEGGLMSYGRDTSDIFRRGLHISIASSRVPTRQNFRRKRRPNLNLPSISRPRRRSA
jgi:putative tryptophan/tyrosine transport system substrate-binding protein